MKLKVRQCQYFVVNGDWTTFGPWEFCSETCGEGVTFRTRTCTDPSPANGGDTCQGSSQETQLCFEQQCPGKKKHKSRLYLNPQYCYRVFIDHLNSQYWGILFLKYNFQCSYHGQLIFCPFFCQNKRFWQRKNIFVSLK